MINGPHLRSIENTIGGNYGKNQTFDSYGGGKTLLLGFALLVIALAATGCEQPDKGPVAVSSITISGLETNAIGFEAGKTFKLTADIQPGNATDKTVVWSSSDETVATVSDDGTVTIKDVGNATITAEAGGKKASDTFVFYKGVDPGFYFNETENTYYIWNVTGLLAWNAYVTTYTGTTDTPEYPNLDTSAKLMADISLEAISWTPVGYYDYDAEAEYYYAGTFDGGGHTISNLFINQYYNIDSGLFGDIATDGVVKNLTLSDVKIISVSEYIGGIAGYNYGTIENCNVSGSISGTLDVGGIVGANYGTITACYNTGEVSGTNSVGGIAGYSYGTISACYNTGSVSGNEGVGGIAGNNNGTITACYWSVPEGSSITGIGDNQGSGSTTQVGENGATWDNAKEGRNNVLSESEYIYKENDDSTTKETMPLVIVKSSN